MPLTRCQHTVVSLISEDVTKDQRIEVFLARLDLYVVCTRCGEIGYYRRSRRAPLTILKNGDDSERIKKLAEAYPNNIPHAEAVMA